MNSLSTTGSLLHGCVRRARLFGVATAVLLGMQMTGCRTLPEVHAASPAHATPVVEVKGEPVSPAQARQVLAQVKAEGRPELLANQLRATAGTGSPLIPGNAVELLIDGPATYKAMFQAVRTARRSILLESYIIEDADVSRALADLLIAKRQEGVSVHLIYDGIGSLTTPAEYFGRLRDGGVQVCEFNPVHPARPFHLLKINNRDHRKILVVDDAQAFTGGINISSVYSSGSSSMRRRVQEAKNKEDGWRDTQVGIRGPAAIEFSKMFADTWRRQACKGEAPQPGRIAPAAGERTVQVIASSPSEETATIYRAFVTAIDASRESVQITMAYFAPDDRTMQALKDAARRGVKVQMILPGFSDSRLILHAGRAHYNALLEAGIEIYERHDALLHAKTAVIDGVWSTVGSTNLDWRSFLHNDEVNAVVLGEDFGAAMRTQFLRDLNGAKRITLEEWRDRGIGPRFMETFARMWEYLL